MNPSASTRGYDLFKAIVALILLILLLWFWLTGSLFSAPLAAAPVDATLVSQPAATSATPQPSRTPAPLQPSATFTVQPSPTFTSTPTTAPAFTATPAPTLVDTPQPTAEPAATASPTEAATTTPEPTATAAPAQAAADCPLALPTRLQVGDTVRVLSNLNMRSAPEIGTNLLLTNPVGTQLSIVGGPVCGLYLGGAYLWWQVSRSDGQTGWSAEGSLNSNAYFLEPVD